MKNIKHTKIFLFFILFAVLNVIQAWHTELLNDEAYYWMYSQFPDWGYLDHPPMIAWLVKAGSIIFHGEFGVRFILIILGMLNVYLLYRLVSLGTQTLNQNIFILLVASSVFINLYSFLALPDAAMMTFSTLFFFSYYRYLQKDSKANGLLMALAIALLFYSKYHGVLIVLFTLLSNLSLLKKARFWLFVFLPAGVLFVPYFFWLIQNDFVTLRFQFFERGGANVFYVFNYIGEQILITGPLVLLLLAFIVKKKTKFEKALAYNVYGIFIFFLIMSFFGVVNLHWTSIAWTPLLILGYNGLVEIKRKILTNTIYSLLFLNLAAVVVLRIVFGTNIFVIPGFNNLQKEEFAEKIYSMAGGKKVMFYDCYNEPSIYNFYTDGFAAAASSIHNKRSQYDLWKPEKNLQQQTVGIITRNKLWENSEEFSAGGRKYYYSEKKNFTSWHYLLNIKQEPSFCSFSSFDSTLHLRLKIINTSASIVVNPSEQAGKSSFYLVINSMKKKLVLIDSADKLIFPLQPLQEKVLDFEFKLPVNRDEKTTFLKCQVAIQTEDLPVTYCSKEFRIAKK